MPSTSVRCPQCEAILKLASLPPEGKKIRCPKCVTAFVPAENEVADEASDVKTKADRPVTAVKTKADRPVTGIKTKANRTVLAATSKSPAKADDDEEELPRNRKTRAEKDDDDDDRPRRGKGKNDPDDDEDDRPRGKGKKKPASKMGLILGLGAGVGVLLLVCGGAAGGLIWWLTSKPQNQVAQVNPAPVVQPGPVVKNDPNPPVVKNDPKSPVVNEQPKKKPKNNPNPKVQPEPMPPPPPPEPPAPAFVAEPVDLDQDLLTKATRATAFLRVERGNQTITGSGFIVKSSGDTAYVVTSLNVILPPDPGEPKQGPGGPPKGFFPGGGFGPKKKGGPAPAPKVSSKITVVLQSGTPEEQTLPAEIVAIDDEGGLAAVRIKGGRNLPAPFDSKQEANVAEDQPVYFFGHPMLQGQKGNPAASAGKGSITRLRRDANNEITDVELAGNMPLGSVGGPVIDGQGRLVGVAVGTVPSKQIGFAIPIGELLQMFKGRLAVGAVLLVRQQGGRTDLVAGERWVHDRKNNVRARDVIASPPTPQPKKGKGIPPPPAAEEFVVLAVLADPMFKISGVKAYYAMTETVPEAANETGWTKLPKATLISLEMQDQLAVGPFTLPKGANPDQTFAFQFSYVNADKQTVFTQPHLVRLTFPTSTKSVTINITGIPDLPTRQYIEDTAESKFNAKVTVKSKTQDGLVLVVDPVPDPNVIQAKIDFGKVTSAQGRTFAVTAAKIALPTPTDAEVTKALEGLKSKNGKQRRAFAEVLARAYVPLPARRAEVAKALEGLVADPAASGAALQALRVWGGPENVPGVVPGLQNVFTRADAFNVLAKFPNEPAAATGLATMLPDWGARARASFLLKKMGPVAEKAVIPFATHKDGGTAQEACRILSEIGTAQCIPALTEASNSNDNNTKNAARDALNKVKARK